MKKFFASPVGLFFFLHLFIFQGCNTPRPDNLGIKEGKLAPCPEKPNCFSSQEIREENKTEPIEHTMPKEVAYQKMLEVLKSFPQAKIISQTNEYIHAEFTSSVFKFVDDLEVYFDYEKNLIHLRSASRTGHYDFGTNKKRIHNIKFLFFQI